MTSGTVESRACTFHKGRPRINNERITSPLPAHNLGYRAVQQSLRVARAGGRALRSGLAGPTEEGAAPAAASSHSGVRAPSLGTAEPIMPGSTLAAEDPAAAASGRSLSLWHCQRGLD